MILGLPAMRIGYECDWGISSNQEIDYNYTTSWLRTANPLSIILFLSGIILTACNPQPEESQLAQCFLSLKCLTSRVSELVIDLESVVYTLYWLRSRVFCTLVTLVAELQVPDDPPVWLRLHA